MKRVLLAAFAAFCCGAAHAADLIGYVSITGGNVANFSDLEVQFPSVAITHYEDYRGAVGDHGDCVFLAGSFSDPCTFDGAVSATSFSSITGATRDLDSMFHTGLGFGTTGNGPEDFWVGFTLDTGDRVVATFHRESAGAWTSPLDPSQGAVPEPTTWALMIGGFGLAGAALRRRRAEVA